MPTLQGGLLQGAQGAGKEARKQEMHHASAPERIRDAYGQQLQPLLQGAPNSSANSVRARQSACNTCMMPVSPKDYTGPTNSSRKPLSATGNQQQPSCLCAARCLISRDNVG